MGDVEAGLLHRGEHRLRRRRRRGEELHRRASSGFFSCAGAFSSVDMTIGAPHRCVTPWSASASYIAAART